MMKRYLIVAALLAAGFLASWVALRMFVLSGDGVQVDMWRNQQAPALQKE